MAALLGLLAVGSASATSLSHRISDELAAQSLAGAVWFTLQADAEPRLGAAGLADMAQRVPMRPDHRVQVGSIAKTVLAIGVLRLVSEGRLGLDDEVAPLLPTLRFANPWAATDPLRLRHLLDHTGGLDDARMAQIFSVHARADSPLDSTFRDAPIELRARPGRHHSYSNSGYTLLGMIIEQRTGQPYERYLTEQVLQPLGMADSRVDFSTQESDPRLAFGHYEQGAPAATVPLYLRPAGQFSTTAADMVRLAEFLLGDGRGLVEPTLLAAMAQPRGSAAAEAGLSVGYALGLATRDRHGAVGQCHGGSTLGFRAMFCLFREQRRAYFIGVNADVEGADYGRLAALLIGELGVSRSAEPPPDISFDGAAWAGHYVPAPNRFARFAWLDTVFGGLQLRPSAGGLIAIPSQGDPQSLHALSNRLLRADGRILASHLLFRDADGRRMISTGTQSYGEISDWKLGLLRASAAAAALGLLWLLAAAVAGGWRDRPLRPALLGTLALVLPLALLAQQSFLALGDMTAGSLLLAAMGILWPLALLLSLRRLGRLPAPRRREHLHALALLALLQGLAVLAAWGLWPLRLWA